MPAHVHAPLAGIPALLALAALAGAEAAALLVARSVARLGGPDDLFPRALAGLHRLCRC